MGYWLFQEKIFQLSEFFGKQDGTISDLLCSSVRVRMSECKIKEGK